MNLKIHVTRIKIKKKALHLSLECAAKINPDAVSLIYNNITEDKTFSFEYETHYKGNQTFIKARLDTAGKAFQEGDWDVFVTCSDKNGSKNIPVILNGQTRISLILGNYQINSDKGHILFPLSGSEHRLSFRYRIKTQYDGSFTRFKEFLVFALYKLFKPVWKKRKTWLIYEKYSSTAQENGYYFFKYCMENLDDAKKKTIYFVLDKHSRDWSKMQCYGKNVVPFMSFRHMLYALTASIYIAPEARNHIYIWKPKPNLLSREINKKKIFFLQHGVLALKRVENLFGKNSGNPMTFFTTSSPMEQKIVVENFGYSPEEAPILGLTRWDVLKDKSSESDKTILVMPTWRSWLEDQNNETFCRSDYYHKYTSLIQNKELAEFLKEHHMKMIFYIHPKLREFMEIFHSKHKNVELITFGSIPLNDLLMKCSMLVTDYSSVCWDMFYQEKPILFYQFDLDLYNQTNGSYIDMEKELFGDRYLNEKDLVNGIKEYVENGFKEKKMYASLRENYLPYRDHNNSKRTYDFIIKKGF